VRLGVDYSLLRREMELKAARKGNRVMRKLGTRTDAALASVVIAVTNVIISLGKHSKYF